MVKSVGIVSSLCPYIKCSIESRWSLHIDTGGDSFHFITALRWSVTVGLQNHPLVTVPLKIQFTPPRTMVCWKGSIYYLVPVQSSSFSPFPLFSLFSPCFLESMKSHGISTFFSLIRGFTTCLWIRKVEFMFAGITSFGWGLKYSWKGT